MIIVGGVAIYLTTRPKASAPPAPAPTPAAIPSASTAATTSAFNNASSSASSAASSVAVTAAQASFTPTYQQIVTGDTTIQLHVGDTISLIPQAPATVGGHDLAYWCGNPGDSCFWGSTMSGVPGFFHMGSSSQASVAGDNNPVFQRLTPGGNIYRAAGPGTGVVLFTYTEQLHGAGLFSYTVSVVVLA